MVFGVKRKSGSQHSPQHELIHAFDLCDYHRQRGLMDQRQRKIAITLPFALS